MAQHLVEIEYGVRQVAEPSVPGWIQYEHDGSSHAWCGCGFDTGWVAIAEATEAARAHRLTMAG
ncbi:hypothetical protein AMK27_30775 [Streptomyces sp. CB02009]|uniref:hypothetical protein n=1 Tax=Streptomyces sp. CB02009 TaxID=1703938 RepID=UPI000939DE04|nr:hypothetical protein [Streptomyces sp. CB02009]OKJ52225.1 hypothetical protein AMK27_30775 [Streptomyces sp. CB02009]